MPPEKLIRAKNRILGHLVWRHYSGHAEPIEYRRAVGDRNREDDERAVGRKSIILRAGPMTLAGRCWGQLATAWFVCIIGPPDEVVQDHRFRESTF